MRDAYLYDGEGRNPYDLYDGEEYMDDTEEEEVLPRYVEVVEQTVVHHQIRLTLPRYVEVVYCKDCKLRDLPFEYPSGCHWNPEEEPDDDDYCSKGVRR